ncbi:uncharacterized protein LOC132644094 [Lycium barbarum]|uniref:uncharacterized protein LOC132644094 n=1 Tax=Lycium barbarum TaxID=112863 RepID=UPI00293F795B|nr:uncharacterized protein LOC132644094 [Lycium barbarum]
MDIVDHILEELHFHEPKEEWDRTRWMMTASGKFTIGIAWELLRSKAVKSDVFKNMWISCVHFKISFFFWRLWKYKIPVGEVVRRIGVDTKATCYCYDHRQYETVDHLFVTGNVATKVWTYVKAAVGITTQFQQVRQILQVWWNADCPSMFRTIFKAILMVTMWQIWKWRNTVLHGGKMSINKFAAARRISDGSNLMAEARALHEGDHHFHSFTSLPVKARKILNTEKSHIPYMRIRTAKDHHIPGD